MSDSVASNIVLAACLRLAGDAFSFAVKAAAAAPTSIRSATCAAISYTLKDGKLSGVKLAYNGLAPSPCRAPKLEAVLEGKTPVSVSAAELDAAIAASFVARDGLRATWAYRSLVARNLVLDFIEEQTSEVA